jgi:hypothetical protein
MLREDLVTGTVVSYTGTMPSDESGFAVGAAGEVAIATPTGVNTTTIYRFTPTGVRSGFSSSNVQPVIDAGNVLSTSHLSIDQANTRTAIDLWTSALPGPNLVSPAPVNTRRWLDYRATGGWIAYTKLVGNALEAWTRSPTGVDALASAATVGGIAGLNELGEIVVDTSSGRVITGADAMGPKPALPLGVGGTMLYFDGAWYELSGGSLYRVGAPPPPPPPPPDPDAGEPDAGTTSDAGAPDAAAPPPSKPDGMMPSTTTPGAPPSPPIDDATGDAPSTTNPTDDVTARPHAGASCASTSRPASGAASFVMMLLATAMLRRRRARDR